MRVKYFVLLLLSVLIAESARAALGGVCPLAFLSVTPVQEVRTARTLGNSGELTANLDAELKVPNDPQAIAAMAD